MASAGVRVSVTDAWIDRTRDGGQLTGVIAQAKGSIPKTEMEDGGSAVLAMGCRLGGSAVARERGRSNPGRCPNGRRELKGRRGQQRWT